MGKLINKQAFFIVRFATNLENKPASERAFILNDVAPKTRVLLKNALAVFAHKRSTKK